MQVIVAAFDQCRRWEPALADQYLAGAVLRASTSILSACRKKDHQPGPKPSGNRWFVYLVQCVDGSLYTGITMDVDRRCGKHNAETASRYTRSRLPIEMAYQGAHASRSLALRHEAAIRTPLMTRLQAEWCSMAQLYLSDVQADKMTP